MKYFRVNETDASGNGRDFWEYFSLKEYSMTDEDLLDEAISLFEENNSWVFNMDCRRNRAEQITEEQYNTGIMFNKLFENNYEADKYRRYYNLFPTRIMADMFAKRDHKSGYVRIGHKNYHSVYKVNSEGAFIFVYHHYYDRLGVLPEPPKFF